jgi:hypothetical protein
VINSAEVREKEKMVYPKKTQKKPQTKNEKDSERYE